MDGQQLWADEFPVELGQFGRSAVGFRYENVAELGFGDVAGTVHVEHGAGVGRPNPRGFEPDINARVGNPSLPVTVHRIQALRVPVVSSPRAQPG